jgi:hypothetical protein
MANFISSHLPARLQSTYIYALDLLHLVYASTYGAHHTVLLEDPADIIMMSHAAC